MQTRTSGRTPRPPLVLTPLEIPPRPPGMGIVPLSPPSGGGSGTPAMTGRASGGLVRSQSMLSLGALPLAGRRAASRTGEAVRVTSPRAPSSSQPPEPAAATPWHASAVLALRAGPRQLAVFMAGWVTGSLGLAPPASPGQVLAALALGHPQGQAHGVDLLYRAGFLARGPLGAVQRQELDVLLVQAARCFLPEGTAPGVQALADAAFRHHGCTGSSDGGTLALRMNHRLPTVLVASGDTPAALLARLLPGASALVPQDDLRALAPRMHGLLEGAVAYALARAAGGAAMPRHDLAALAAQVAVLPAPLKARSVALSTLVGAVGVTCEGVAWRWRAGACRPPGTTPAGIAARVMRAVLSRALEDAELAGLLEALSGAPAVDAHACALLSLIDGLSPVRLRRLVAALAVAEAGGAQRFARAAKVAHVAERLMLGEIAGVPDGSVRMLACARGLALSQPRQAGLSHLEALLESRAHDPARAARVKLAQQGLRLAWALGGASRRSLAGPVQDRLMQALFDTQAAWLDGAAGLQLHRVLAKLDLDDPRHAQKGWLALLQQVPPAVAEALVLASAPLSQELRDACRTGKAPKVPAPAPKALAPLAIPSKGGGGEGGVGGEG